MSAQTTQKTIELSKVFSAKLRKVLTPEQMLTITQRNQALEEAGEHQACATHDFVDSNTIMDEAFVEVFGHQADLSGDGPVEDYRAWIDAWSIAKTLRFYPVP